MVDGAVLSIKFKLTMRSSVLFFVSLAALVRGRQLRKVIHVAPGRRSEY